MLFLSILFLVIAFITLITCFVYLFKKQKKKGLIAIGICIISIFLGNICLHIDDKNNEPLYSVDLKKTDTNYDSSERMWTLDADKNGKYTLKLRANKDGKITVTSKSDGVYDPNTNFKTKTYNISSGEIIKVPLSVKNDSNTSAANFYIKADDMKAVEVFLSNPNYSSVTPQKSLANLKATISSPMNMQNYQNVENNVINAAKSYNDIIHGGDDKAAMESRNACQRRYETQLKNVHNLAEKESKDYKSQESHLTSSDWNILQNYQKTLINYLDELYSYATEVQNDTAIINDNDPHTTSDEKKNAQTDLNNEQNKFNTIKKEWQNQYNSIMNRN